MDQLTDKEVRTLFDVMPDALVVADESGQIVSVNARAEDMFGYSHDELLGKTIEVLLPEQLRSVHPEHRCKYAASLLVRPMGKGLDLYARRRDGSEFPVDISLCPLETGHGLLISSVIRDITEYKQILHQLEEARAEADKANHAKGEFLAAASHDLRQPLQTLNLLNSVLEKTTTDPIARSAVNTQQQSLASMSELINALLDISKLESGSIRPDIKDCSVQAIFQHIRASFEQQANAKGLTLVVPNCDAVVHTDSSLLEQIIQNLVANAIRYTRKGLIEIKYLLNSTHVRIDVCDTGIGIPVDQQQSIFDDFYQVDSRAGQKRDGLGLGLGIVRRIAQLINCPVELESFPGKGSTFSVKVPIGLAHELAQPAFTDKAAPHATSALIMLVDDDPGVTTATRMLLELEGHQVVAAASTRESLDLLHSQQCLPDLIVSDYQLGAGDNGINVIGEIRKLAGWSVPAVLVTGDTTRCTSSAVSLTADCELLGKPVEPLEFLAKVNRLLLEKKAPSVVRQ